MDHVTQQTLLGISGADLGFTEEELAAQGINNAYDAVLVLKKLIRKDTGEFDLDQEITRLDIPNWLVRRLRKWNVYTFRDLYDTSEDELTDRVNFGKSSVRRLNEALEKLGLPSLPPI